MESLDVIYIALFIDGMLLAICLALMIAFGQLRHSHPATIYLIFHVIVVTYRLLRLISGSSTLFGGVAWGSSGYYLPITYEEIARAAAYADLILLLMTLAWIWASINDSRKNGPMSKDNFDQTITLNIKYIWRVAIFALPIGLISVVFLTNLPGFGSIGNVTNQRDFSLSGWVLITQTWVGMILLALVYWYGFRWRLMLPMSIYLFVMLYQGYHRFRVLIPLILLVQIYLDRNNRRWPSFVIVVIIIVAGMMFPSLKTVGKMLQTGESLEEILNRSTEIFQGVFSGDEGDGQLLDQFAAYVALTDESGNLNHGQSYVALLVLPIPRQWWPEKPSVNDFFYAISRSYRPVGPTGMTPLLWGEIYINFGFVGFFLIPPLFAYLLARFYFRAYRKNFFSLTRFIYLIIACNLLQIYRDGLTSLIFYTVVHMMPMVFILAAHVFSKDRRYSHFGIPREVSLPPMLQKRGKS
jgi:hypothetical protein